MGPSGTGLIAQHKKTSLGEMRRPLLFWRLFETIDVIAGVGLQVLPWSPPKPDQESRPFAAPTALLHRFLQNLCCAGNARYKCTVQATSWAGLIIHGCATRCHAAEIGLSESMHCSPSDRAIRAVYAHAEVVAIAVRHTTSVLVLRPDTGL